MSARVARVLDTASRLGFRRNDIAASLRRLGQSMATVGLIVEDVGNPFHAALTRGVEEVTRARHYVLLAASSDEDLALERETLGAFLSRRVDGIIVVPAGPDHSYQPAVRALGTGLVFADRPARNLDADCVVGANARGAAEGVRSASIPLDPDLVRQGAHDVAGNNRCTIGAVRSLRSCAGRMALVGFDDFELADVLDPPVTVVGQDAHALGRAAAELLLSRLDGDARPPRTVLLPTTLSQRGSGEIWSPDGTRRTARRRS